ncbi:MAG: gspG [Phycisphaerales bacterium]|jgi:general secretion pathway protein G|nr:gspG [Phycisphaerales bacterium]MDB5356920.1 gspG [Phycisphaerales bacterium]
MRCKIHLNYALPKARKNSQVPAWVAWPVVVAPIVLIIGFAAHVSFVHRPSKHLTAITDISRLCTALQNFESDVGRLPTSQEGLQSLLTMPANNPTGWRGPYIDRLTLDPWGRPYVYRPGGHPGSAYKFDVFSMGADGKAGTADDIGNW